MIPGNVAFDSGACEPRGSLPTTLGRPAAGLAEVLVRDLRHIWSEGASTKMHRDLHHIRAMQLLSGQNVRATWLRVS